MCISCQKKEDLKLPIPDDVNPELMSKYIQMRDDHQLNPSIIFIYFKEIYKGDWVFNPKQVRRAMINMDILYYHFKKQRSVPNEGVITIDNKYTYEQNSEGLWILINQKGVLKKGMKKVYENWEFRGLIREAKDIIIDP